MRYCNWLTLLKREIIAVYCENHEKAYKYKTQTVIGKADGTDSYHWAIKLLIVRRYLRWRVSFEFSFLNWRTVVT